MSIFDEMNKNITDFYKSADSFIEKNKVKEFENKIKDKLLNYIFNDMRFNVEDLTSYEFHGNKNPLETWEDWEPAEEKEERIRYFLQENEKNEYFIADVCEICKISDEEIEKVEKNLNEIKEDIKLWLEGLIC